MKASGIAIPKVVGIVLAVMLGVAAVTTGLVAAIPQARLALQDVAPVVRHVPAIGPATGQTYRVEGPSMAPTYTSGEYVTLLPLTAGRPQLCDVVAFHPSPNIVYLKRVVAIGPATAMWTANSVEVNGAPACPAYLRSGSVASGSQSNTLQVPAGMYFVVGDNLLNSADSRVFGPIAGGSIVGYLPG